jgi:hypothetical protein
MCHGVIEWDCLRYRADGAELRSFLQRATSGTFHSLYAALQLPQNANLK